MWIIPKNLNTLVSVQDTEAWISDLDGLSELCEQSLLARSSTTPARTWSRRLRQDSLTARLSGRTLKPSRGARFVDEWTSSLGASLASPSAQQGEEQETATHDTCGHTSPAALESWDDLPLFSSRTWTESLAPSSPAQSGQTPQERPFCTMSSASWSAWVTAQRQEYSARAKSARRTSVSACSLWACEMTLTSPRAVLFQRCLSAQGGATSQHGPLDEGPRNTLGNPHESLHPRWVETLMGLPVGWTMATCATPWTVAWTNCAYLETESSPPPQKEPSASSGDAWPTPLFWKSPVASDGEGGALKIHSDTDAKYKLRDQAAHQGNGSTWPTPQARDHKGSSGRSNAGEELDRPAAVQRATHPRVPPSDLAD